MKIRPVGAEFFHADGQPDLTKLTLALRNFENKPKKSNSHSPLSHLRDNIRLPAWNRLSQGISAED
jgi:hypothetical protein